MTEKQANEILRTKYPEATIFKRNSMGGTSSSALAVIFKAGGKVYDYQASSYQQVLEKLGFNILYKHNVDNMLDKINDLKKKIDDGGYKYIFSIGGNDFHTYTEKELSNMKKEIEDITQLLSNAIIV